VVATRNTRSSEVELIRDLEPLEVTDTDAEKFRKENGNKCDFTLMCPWFGD
jgi:hypothetical protein